jgi:hypothetical protein
MTHTGHLATKQIINHLMGSGMPAQALKAVQNGRNPSRYVAFGDPGCEHLFKVIHALPVPFRAALPNAAFKCRLGHKKLPFTGGSVGQLPHLKGYRP